MSIETDKYNSYNVTYVFDDMSIITTVFAMNEEVAIPMAADLIYQSLGFSELSSFLSRTQEVFTELLDEDVL